MDPHSESKNQDPLVALLASYASMFTRGREIVSQARSAARTRYVWFVGICGYVLFNAPSLWESFVGHKLTRCQLVALSLPWVLSALSALIAHVLLDITQERDDEFFVSKLSALEVTIINIQAGSTDRTEVLRVFNDQTPAISGRKSRLEAIAKPARCIERLTLWLLILSFLWSLCGPLIFLLIGFSS